MEREAWQFMADIGLDEVGASPLIMKPPPRRENEDFPHHQFCPLVDEIEHEGVTAIKPESKWTVVDDTLRALPRARWAQPMDACDELLCAGCESSDEKVTRPRATVLVAQPAAWIRPMARWAIKKKAYSS